MTKTEAKILGGLLKELAKMENTRQDLKVNQTEPVQVLCKQNLGHDIKHCQRMIKMLLEA